MTAIPLVGRSAILDSLEAQLSRGQGVLLAGPAGVGKSRLLDELLTLSFARNCHIERFVGTDAGQLIRFGALISMVCENTSSDVSRQLAAIRTTLLARADGRPLLVAVDDLHLLDEASIACVADLVHRRDATLLATVRTDDDVPATVTALWANEAVERVAVDPISDEATAAMVTGVLGRPADDDLVREVIDRSGNNPLFVRELILDGLASSAIVHDDQFFRLASTLETGPRLADVVRARTGRLSAGERVALEMVAFGEPINVEVLAPHERDTIGPLERAGLVRSEVDDGLVRVRCDHPVIGEAIRRDTPDHRRVEVLAELVDGYERIACPDPGDAVRVAGWCSSIGRTASPPIANRASREAMAALDLDLALSLATAAVDGDERCEHLITLGEIRRMMSQPGEADACFERALAVSCSEADDAAVTKCRALLHTHQLGRPDLAIKIAADGAARLNDPRLVVELEQIAADFSGMLGRYDEVLRASTRLLQHDDGKNPAARRATLNNLIYAQVMVGNLDKFDERIDECAAFAEASTDQYEWQEVLWALRTGVFIQRGQLATGEQALRARIADHPGDQPVGLAATMRIQLLLYRASPEVFDLIGATVADLRRTDSFGALPITAALAACAFAQTGQLDEAEAMLALIPDQSGDARSWPFVARGRAAVLAMKGDVERATALVIDAGRAAISSTYVIFGVTTLHDAVRFGAAGAVADEMASTTRDSTGAFTRLIVADAVATRDEDGRALARIGASFHQFGAPLMAADAFTRATRFLDPDSTDARLADAKRSLLAKSVEPYLTPAGAEVVGGLTAREFDVAAAATRAMTSREIAEAQFVSVRTVDNHLRQVYRKLGVQGRTELADVLGPFAGSGQTVVSHS